MDLIQQLLSKLAGRVEKLESGFQIRIISIPTNGAFIIKVLAGDPGTPINNEVWINSNTNQLSWNKSGTIKRVTLT